MPVTNKASAVPEAAPASVTPSALATPNNTTPAVVKPHDTALAPAEPETGYDALPEKLRQVSTAMEEVCKVLYGDGFKKEHVWSADSAVAEKDLTKFLAELPLEPKIKATLAKVKEGINKVDPLKQGVDAMLIGMHSVVVEIDKGAEKVKDTKGLVDPVVQLTQQLLPHVVTAVKAATGEDIGTKVNAALDFIRGAEAVVRLGLFAAALVGALEKYMSAA